MTPQEIKAQELSERRARLLARLPDNPLIHILVFNPVFRLVVLLPIVGLIAAAVVLPKLWVTSPADFDPRVKVSVLDLIQAWSLKRSAERLAAEGKPAEAARAWQAAWANNPADSDLLRRTLRATLEQRSVSRTEEMLALRRLDWLLRLTRTNRLDAGLAAQVAHRFEHPELAVSLLVPVADGLSLAEEETYLKALFDAGRYPAFAARWAQVGGQFQTNRALRLYHEGYLAGWGPPESAGPARDELARAAAAVPPDELANRLQLLVAAKLLDADGVQQSLARLQEINSVRFQDRLTLWKVLFESGRKGEARRLAQSDVSQPSNALELLALVAGLRTLDLESEALKSLEQFAPQFGDSDHPSALQIWLVYARVLMDAKDWQGLEHLAVRMRALPRAGNGLAGYSYVLEGRAQAALDLADQATASFQKAAERPFTNARLGLLAGKSLLDAGHADLALRVLRPLSTELDGDSVYWEAVVGVLFALRQDSGEALRAATRLHQLAPGTLSAQLNYAAALLVARHDPQHVLAVTLATYQANPRSVRAYLNHAAALAQNRRFVEADAFLERLDVGTLDTEQRAAFYLIRLETSAGRQQLDRAQRALDNLQTNVLFPAQRDWVDQLRAGLPAKAK